MFGKSALFAAAQKTHSTILEKTPIKSSNNREERNPVTLKGYSDIHFVKQTGKKKIVPKSYQGIHERPLIECPKGKGCYNQNNGEDLFSKIERIDKPIGLKIVKPKENAKEIARPKKRYIVPIKSGYEVLKGRKMNPRRDTSTLLKDSPDKSNEYCTPKARPETEAYNYRTKKLQKENEIRIFENRSRRSYHAPKSYNEGKELKEIISYSGMRFREERLTEKPNSRSPSFSRQDYANSNAKITEQEWFGRRSSDITSVHRAQRA